MLSSVCVCVCVSDCPSVRLSGFLPAWLPACLPVCLCPCVRVSVPVPVSCARARVRARVCASQELLRRIDFTLIRRRIDRGAYYWEDNLDEMEEEARRARPAPLSASCASAALRRPAGGHASFFSRTGAGCKAGRGGGRCRRVRRAPDCVVTVLCQGHGGAGVQRSEAHEDPGKEKPARPPALAGLVPAVPAQNQGPSAGLGAHRAASLRSGPGKRSCPLPPRAGWRFAGGPRAHGSVGTATARSARQDAAAPSQTR